MFRRLPETASDSAEVTLWVDGEPRQVGATLSVAAALLQQRGWAEYRLHHDGTPRAPLCMMGVCHDCLITIDGEPNRQGCLVIVKDGMRIETQMPAAQPTPGASTG